MILTSQHKIKSESKGTKIMSEQLAPNNHSEPVEGGAAPIRPWEDYQAHRGARDHLKVVVDEAQRLPEDYSDINDIVTVDERGRGHHHKNEDISGRRAGQFLSDYEMQMIQENQDLIREGVKDRGNPFEPEPPKDIDNEPPHEPEEEPESPTTPEEPAEHSEQHEDQERETLAHMQAELAVAEQNYAEQTAKSRKSYLGRLCQGRTRVGKIILKTPGVRGVVESLNKRLDTKAQAAKVEYEHQFNELGARVADGLRQLGYSEEAVRGLAATGVIMRSAQLEQLILTERKMQSKETNKFVNWWVNAKDTKGKLKKAGIVAGAGAVTGLTAGLALPAYLALFAGGAAGGGIARHITRRRANAVGADGKSLAYTQATQDQNQEHRLAYQAYQDGEFARVEDITDHVEYRTADEMLGNRRRMKAAVAIGKGAAGLSALGLHMAQGMGHNTAHAATGPEHKPSGGSAAAGTGKPNVAHGAAGSNGTHNTLGATSKPNVDPGVGGNYQYPWNWAEAQYGQGHGAQALQNLANKAQAGGHKVVWHNANTPQAWLEVDGQSNTQAVITVLNQFR